MARTQEIKQLCPVVVTLETVGGKWKLIILWHLSKGTHRFSQLEKKIDGITQKMLAQELRAMERDGLIDRKVYPVVPPKVEYSLTKHGRSLNAVLDSLSSWGEKHQQRVQ